MGSYFPCICISSSGKMGLILCAPTIHGNMYVGPSATDVDDKEGVNTTRNYR